MRAQDDAHSLIAALVHHYDELVRHAGRVFQGRSAHQARDMAREAVHEVCLQLLRQDVPTGTVRIPLAFLLTLSRRRAIDCLRGEVLRQSLNSSLDLHPECLDLTACANQEPEHRYYARQQFELLVQAIESLPPRCRDVFVLCNIHQWPQRQIADHLGISLKTVEKHLRTGIACCRFALVDVLNEAGVVTA